MSNFVKLEDGSYAEVDSVGYVSGYVVDASKEFGVPVRVEVPPTPPPPETCAAQTTESACKTLGCYWYDGVCHSKAKTEIPWTYIAIAVGGVITVIGILLAIRRR